MLALGRARPNAPGVSATNSQKGVAGPRRMAIGNVAFWALLLATRQFARRAPGSATPGGKTKEWCDGTFPAYQRRTKRADALIVGFYLLGTYTRRVRRALAVPSGGAVGKDTVSRVWRKTKGDWDVWNARSLKEEPIIRLILDGTVVRVRLDKKATSISLLVALGVRADGQKPLAIKSMGNTDETVKGTASSPGRRATSVHRSRVGLVEVQKSRWVF